METLGTFGFPFTKTKNFSIEYMVGENMPAVKATAKKTVKTAAKKPIKKTAKKITLDDISANFDRIQKAHEELEKAHKETEKTLTKAIGDLSISHKETEKAIKDTQRNIGGLNNTVGSLVEHIMAPDLPRKFKQFGFTFSRITTVKWAYGEGTIYTEIDGLLENGNQAMVVEIKTTLRREDIDDHLKRMEKVRKYADDHGDKREFLGAMAAMITDKATKEYALAQGFFVIEPSGEDVTITKPVSDPKVW
jgi:hypothetical protein